MSIVGLVILLVFVGLVLWAINAYIPMQDGVKKILNAVVIIVLVLFLISVFMPGLFNTRVPTVH